MEAEILHLIPAPGWQVVWAGENSYWAELLVAWALVKVQDEDEEGPRTEVRGVHLEDSRFPTVVSEMDWAFLGYRHEDMKPRLDWATLGKAACEQHRRESKPPPSFLEKKT